MNTYMSVCLSSKQDIAVMFSINIKSFASSLCIQQGINQIKSRRESGGILGGPGPT